MVAISTRRWSVLRPAFHLRVPEKKDRVSVLVGVVRLPRNAGRAGLVKRLPVEATFGISLAVAFQFTYFFSNVFQRPVLVSRSTAPLAYLRKAGQQLDMQRLRTAKPMAPLI